MTIESCSVVSYDDSLTGFKLRILEFIKAHPGVHFREIKRSMNVATGTLQYHLRVLEKQGSIVSRRSGIFKRFYPNLKFGEKEMSILEILSGELERQILLFVIQNPGCNQKRLSEYLHVSAATALWHMKKLLNYELVRAIREGTSVKYYVTIDSNELLPLLRAYHYSLWEIWSDRLADLPTEISDTQDTKEESSEDASED